MDKEEEKKEETETVVLGIDIGIVNLSYCVLSGILGKNVSVLEWKRISLLEHFGFAPNVTFKKFTMADMIQVIQFGIPRLFSTELLKKHKVEHVVIEQQMRKKPMVVLSQLLLHFFRNQMDQCTTRIQTNYKLSTCALIPASRKYEIDLLDAYDEKKQALYKNRKLLSVRLMKHLCKDLCLELPSDGNGAKKMDDLADSFLLAYSGLRRWVQHRYYYGSPPGKTDVFFGMKAFCAGEKGPPSEDG